MVIDNSYNADALQVLDGLDPVRKRPNMYTETSRPNHMVQEPIDNAVDEALAGYATAITVVLERDGTVCVSDNGRGMPVDIHPKFKISGVELILTKLHAGAKFSNKSYQFSGGLHGVGISVTNALSTDLEVTVKRDGAVHCMRFQGGYVASPLETVGKVAKRDTGTTIRFTPDPQYFDNPAVHAGELAHLLRAKAILCAGLEVKFVDESHDVNQLWHYPTGIEGYVNDAVQSVDVMPSPPFVQRVNQDDFAMDWLVTWAPDGGLELRESYVNLIPTPQGGTHVNGLRLGLLEAVREFCELRQLLPKGLKLRPEDIWESCLFIISIKIPEPQFAGQTKQRLVNQQITGKISSLVHDQFSLWLNQHVAEAEVLVDYFIQVAQSRVRAGQKTLRKKYVAGPRLPGKLTDCMSQDMMDSELFLVEGDSAGGSARQARDKNTQAVLPLKGKIMNTWEVDQDKLLQSKEVHDIAVAIGVDPGSADLSQLRYGKICILTDADSDGSHISTLLCALFLKHFRPVVEKGHVFVALPPLYRIDHHKQVYYAQDDAEKEHILAQIKKKQPNANLTILRFKGLGEMDALQLRETTMAVQTRRLLQLNCDDWEFDEAMFGQLLAKKQVASRRRWLMDKGKLADLLD